MSSNHGWEKNECELIRLQCRYIRKLISALLVCVGYFKRIFKLRSRYFLIQHGHHIKLAFNQTLTWGTCPVILEEPVVTDAFATNTSGIVHTLVGVHVGAVTSLTGLDPCVTEIKCSVLIVTIMLQFLTTSVLPLMLLLLLLFGEWSLSPPFA